jgi:HEAT repeat protein
MRVFGRIHQAEQAAQATTPFSTAFANPDWTFRLAAIERLAHVEREIALPWLERALSDAHPSVRTWAVHVLGQHQASELILPALHDQEWQVREAALLVLSMQEAQMSQELLAHAQSDPDAAVSQTAQELLHRQPLP